MGLSRCAAEFQKGLPACVIVSSGYHWSIHQISAPLPAQEAQPQYAVAVCNLEPPSRERCRFEPSCSTSVHPLTQLSAHPRSAHAGSSPALQVPAFLGDIEDPQAALLGCAVCGVTLVAYCVAQVLYPEMQKKRIEKARRHRWAMGRGAPDLRQ